MNETIKPAKPEKSPLDNFRDKMRGLKTEEELDGVTAHFNLINPSELDEKDMGLYEIVSKEKVEFEEATKKVQERADELQGSANISQIQFRDYLANLLTIWLEKLK